VSGPSNRFPNLPNLPKLPPTPNVFRTGAPKQELVPVAPLPKAPGKMPAMRVTPPDLPPLPQVPAVAQIPQGGLPPLPRTPPATPWIAKTSPSAHLVQKQYVETRLEELEANRKPGRKAALDVLHAMLLAKAPLNKKPKKIPFKELLRVYDAIERNLQSAELTVNFKCETWFMDENPYDTYTQMYQRAVEGNRMVLRNTDVNNADDRALADNAITFPTSWQRGQAPLQRGLRPGRQSPERIQRQMDTGPLVPIHKPEDLPAFLAGNPHFNPHTKQVFLALNYGRRPHGSSINYGYSHFVAKGDLKAKCFYYAQDTFMRAKKGVDAGSIQVPYDELAALLEGNGDPHLQEAIFASCYEGKMLEDEVKTLCKYYLVEAHHFGEMTFGEHVDYMVISPEGISSRSLWPRVVANASKFAKRNKIRLFQTD
jgi:hypothetical protein